MRESLGSLLVALCVGLAAGQSSECYSNVGDINSYSIKAVDEVTDLNFNDQAGKVILIVNVATF